MDETTVSKQNMDSLKALSDVNLKISEAKNLLFKLQEDETEYLELREKKALDKIKGALIESSNIVKETEENHDKVHDFCKKVSEYADFLFTAHERFRGMIEVFNKKNELWDEIVRKQDEDIAHQRNLIKQDVKSIEEREGRMVEAVARLKADREHLESQQVTLAASFQLEKDLWNKIHKA